MYWTAPYTVRLIVTTLTLGCKDTADLVITVSPQPTITLNPASGALCAGDSLVITALVNGNQPHPTPCREF